MPESSPPPATDTPPFLDTTHVTLEALLEKFSELDCYVLSVLNPDGSIHYEPPYITELTGYEVEEYLGRSSLDFIHPEDQPKIIALLDKIYRDPSAWTQRAVVYRWRHKEGHWLTVNSAGVLLRNKDNRVEGMVLVSHDLSPYTNKIDELQEQIKRLQHDLSLVRLEIEESSTPIEETDVSSKASTRAASGRVSRANMIRLFDHELRTPLHTIQGYVELLLEEQEDHPNAAAPTRSGGLEEQEQEDDDDDAYASKAGSKQELLRIKQASRQLHSLIERLVELARYEDDDMDLQLERVSFGSFCEEFIEQFRGTIEIKWCANARQRELYTDRAKLRQTLAEQARFLMRQGIPLKLCVGRPDRCTMCLCWEIEPGALTPTTRQHLEQVLHPDFSLDAYSWGRHYLAIHLGKCRLEALGGHIEFDPGEQPGRFYWVNALPANSTESKKTPTPASLPSVEQEPGQRYALEARPDMIFIGSDQGHRTKLEEWSRIHDLRFLATLDAERVKEFVQRPAPSSSEEPGAILASTHDDGRSGVMMVLVDVLDAHVDGWRLLMELRALSSTHPLCLIVYAALEDIGLARELGADDCINKMQPFVQIDRALTRHLASWRGDEPSDPE